jgi:hypothetical protein
MSDPIISTNPTTDQPVKLTQQQIEQQRLNTLRDAEAAMRDAANALDFARQSSAVWLEFRSLIAKRDSIRQAIEAGEQTRGRLEGVARPGWPQYERGDITGLLETGGFVASAQAVLALYAGWLGDRQTDLAATTARINELAQQNGFTIPT